MAINMYIYLSNFEQGGAIMKKICAFALLSIGLLAANAASTASAWLLLDEPEMPKSLIN